MLTAAVLVAALALASAAAPGAGETASPSTVPFPQYVTVGVFVNQINSLNLHDNCFSADFNVWFRWRGDHIDPLSTFELSNGKIDVREKDYRSKVGDENYASCRVLATISEFWDLAAFPLDNHVLELAIEDQVEDHKVVFVPDKENTALNPAVQVPGWSVGKPRAKVIKNVYCTNYGDTSLPTGHKSSYSRFVFSIPVTRPGYGYSLKLFLGLMVATALAFAMFFAKPSDDPRFNLGVGAIFAAVASEYIVAGCLPATHVLTLADAMHMLVLVVIFAAIAESIVALRWERAGKLEAALRLDLWSYRALLAAFAGSCAMLFFSFCRGA